VEKNGSGYQQKTGDFFAAKPVKLGQGDWRTRRLGEWLKRKREERNGEGRTERLRDLATRGLGEWLKKETRREKGRSMANFVIPLGMTSVVTRGVA
jgi:hypothetical protein